MKGARAYLAVAALAVALVPGGQSSAQPGGNVPAGYDLFETCHVPPVVSVCKGRYVFEPGGTETVGRPVEERCPPEVAGNP